MLRLACLLTILTGCGDPPGPRPPVPFEWNVDLSELDDALLSAWIGGPDEALAVGGAGRRGAIYAWDGARWDAALLPEDTPALWWTWAMPDGGDAFASGDEATLLRRSDGLWRREPLDGLVADDQTLYGVWGFSPEDVWFVGGTLVPRADPGVIVHWDGLGYTSEPAPTLLFKVWGAAPDDVWAVGEGGAILHFDGGGWSASDSTTTDRLIAVWGRNPADVYAVGGVITGIVLRWDGQAWSRFAEAPEALAGVWTAPERPLYVGGSRGYLARLGPDHASVVAIPDVDFHALAGAGELLVAVGADLLTGGAEGWRGALASHGMSLAGPIQPPPPSPDGPALDAPPAIDGTPVDASGPGEGEPCLRPDGGNVMCRSDLECWLIFDDSAIICTENCDVPADCAAYGEGACCTRPGFQTFEDVCIPRGYSPCP